MEALENDEQVRDEVRSEETNSLISTSLCYFFHQLLKSLLKCFGYDQHHTSEESEQSVENTNVASSSSSPPQKHDVFLSFRGEDTRAKFTSHLEKRLRDMKIETFIDNRLKKGDKISTELIEAIRSSKMSVVVFSLNYATSSWCLEEVLYIVECMEKQGQVVIPVFYEVDPSHVRKQKGAYEAAFKDLKERFKDKEVNKWRAALTQLANLSGFPYPSQQYETESVFIDEIVADILKKLEGMSPSDDHSKRFVGIDESVQGVKNLLQLDSRDVRIIGIWGMGGLGKTTIARVIFKQLTSNFEGCCFLENVREQSATKGLDNLKKKLYGVLLDGRELEDILPFHEKRLSRKKVLIVLDDVDQLGQLDYLAGDQDMFGHGSRVIVTTRAYDTIRNKVDVEYQLEGLSHERSLELFILKAFKRNYSPTIDDIELSEQVVNYAKGIPLALVVLGSFLCSQKRENWVMLIDKLKDNPHEIVQRSLRISYDGLKKHEQRVFLDIVCYVDVGESTCRHFVEGRVDGGGRSVKLEIDHLIDKSLIFEEQGNLRMHDLVREMGWEIVRQQSEEPGERSRLWNAEDCYHVFQNNTGTEAIQGISESSQYHKPWKSVELSPLVFKKMRNLWFLRIKDHFQGAYTCRQERLEDFPSTLKYLEWNYWPFKYMPTSFSLSNLVELRIPHCKLETLIWSEDLKNLKHVDLSRSEMLTDVSALSMAPNLESVDLSYCRSLRKVPPLRFGNKSYHKCDYQRCLNLGYLNLGYNMNLEVLSRISGNVKRLNIYGGILEQLPSDLVSYISSLEVLDLTHCRMLKHLPACIWDMEFLKTLNLGRCNISKIPNEIGCLSLLEKLDLSQNPIGELPEGIKQLSKLKKLMIHYCNSLELLPELPPSIELVNAYRCTKLHTISDSRDKLKQEQLSDYHVTRHRTFIYAECSLNADTCSMIVEEFQLRVLRLAAKIDSNNFKDPEVYICIPRYKIPEWFTQYSEASTINVKLPSQWHNAAFLGFAICVEVERLRVENLLCNLNFKMNNGEIRRFEWKYIETKTEVEAAEKGEIDFLLYLGTYGSNMLMWYKYENYSDCHDAEAVSLNVTSVYNENHEVRACGIRLLYRQEYEEKFEKSNVVSNKSEPRGSGTTYSYVKCFGQSIKSSTPHFPINYNPATPMAEEAKAKGNAAFAARDYTAAVGCYSEAIALAPTNHVLYSNRSAAHASLQNYAEALADAEKTVELNPYWAKGYGRLAAAHLGLGNPDLAVANYKKGLDIDPTNEALKSGLADAEAAAKRSSSSASANSPFGDAFSGPEMWAKLTAEPATRAYLQMPDFVSMMKEIQKNPNNLNVYLKDQRVMQALGVLCNVKFRPPTAEEEREASAAPSSSSSSAPLQESESPEPEPMEVNDEEKEKKERKAQALKEREAGNVAYKKKDFDTAIEHYSKAIEMDDEDVSFILNRAATYLEMGKCDEFIKDCDKAVERGRELRSDPKMIAKALLGNEQCCEICKH